MTLEEYIEGCKGKKFEWGKLDCLKFVGYYLRDTRDFYPIDLDSLNYDTKLGALKCMKQICVKFGARDFDSVMDKLLPRAKTFAQGYVVSQTHDKDWKQYGIVYQGACLFITESGLQLYPRSDLDLYWRV